MPNAPSGPGGGGPLDPARDAPRRDGELATRVRGKVQRPPRFKVLLYNDDYTPMEFVVYVLQRFFAMPDERARQIMLHVHQRGVGVCGVYTYEVAETKVNQVMDLARENQHPLQCTIEKDGDDDGDK